MERLSGLPFFRSCFLRVNERDGLVVAAHQLHPEPVFFARTGWTAIERSLETNGATVVSHEAREALIQRGLIVTSTATDQEELVIARAHARHRLLRPTILYLMMAQGCNWECQGCPIPGLVLRHGERSLSFEDAMSGMALWQRHIATYPSDDEPYYLIFYGGEPLLNRAVLERLMPVIREEHAAGRLPGKLELMLCTNGELVDAPLAELLAAHSVTVALGMDGSAHTNDLTRRTRTGLPTAATIEQAIRLLLDHRVRVVVSTTITPVNAGELPLNAARLKSLGVAGVGLNLLKGAALMQLTPEERDAYAKLAAKTVLAGLQMRNGPDSFFEYQLEKKLCALRSGLPYSVDCTCHGNQIVIQPDGHVGNCPFVRHDMGQVRQLPEEFRIGRTAIVRSWQERLPIFGSDVDQGKRAGWLDGGGCAWGSKALSGDEAAADTCNAMFVQEVQHELIWTLLPADRASALRRGELTHWADRRLRPLLRPGP